MLVLLIGSKACGKSTVGPIFARKLKLPFEDADEVLESIYAERFGKRLGFREIFRREGPEPFALLEAEAVQKCLRAGDRVVALGGGAPARLELKGEFAVDVLVVYLEVPEDVLWKRMLRDELPVYLDSEKPREDFQRILNERVPIYERLADLRIGANRDPNKVAEEVLVKVNELIQGERKHTTP